MTPSRSQAGKAVALKAGGGNFRMKCPDSPVKLLLPIAVFSRLQSREGAESIAIRGAPSPGPTMLRGGAGTSPHPPPPTPVSYTHLTLPTSLRV